MYLNLIYEVAHSIVSIIIWYLESIIPDRFIELIENAVHHHDTEPNVSY